jgi:hypothetical protein
MAAAATASARRLRICFINLNFWRVVMSKFSQRVGNIEMDA